ncbi:MAG: hypothetical protein M0P31_01260 [Solirubrobacteraceae bacterium]|nr:hypothetical protein [Solirubrobacteraceae bacterium]
MGRLAQVADIRLDERRRLATLVHDHSLRYVMQALEELRDAPREAPAVHAAEAHLGRALQALRGLTLDARQDVLAEVEPSAALTCAAAEAEADGDLRVDLDVEHGIDWRHTVLLVESTRELLSNVRRHAGAHRAFVTVRVTGGRLRLTVEDDGVGVAAAGAPPSFGSGLWRLDRHAEVLGGGVSVEPRPQGGTRVTLEVPAASRRTTGRHRAGPMLTASPRGGGLGRDR